LVLNSFLFGVSSVFCHFVFQAGRCPHSRNRCLPAVFNYLVFLKFLCYNSCPSI
jgi:hypothetical protein